MSFLGSALKKVGHVLAKPLGVAERVGGAGLGLVTGGIPGAIGGYKAGDALGNITEDALSGRNVGKRLPGNLINGALGAAGAYGATKLPNNGGILNFGRRGPTGLPTPLDMSHIADGVSGHIDQTTAGIPGAWGDVARMGMGGGTLAGLGAGVGSGLLGAAKRVGSVLVGGQAGGQGGGSWLDKLGGLGGLVDGGLGAASIAGGIAAGKKAEDYRNKALGISEGSWNDRAGLRKLAIAGLSNNTPQDLSQVFANPANPFARR